MQLNVLLLVDKEWKNSLMDQVLWTEEIPH